MRRALLLALPLLLLVPAWAGEPGDAQVEAARATLGRYAELVNEHKLDELATLFTDEVDYRSESWIHVQGPDAIVKALKEAYATKPDLRLEIEVGEARRVSKAVVMIDGRWKMWRAPDARPFEGGLTATCVQEDAGWKIAALREWTDERTRRQGLFDGLAWLMGSWTGESQNVPLRVEVSPTPGRGFVHVAMAFGAKEKEPTGLSTLIGLDASTDTVRSWHFLHDGGFGQGTWTVGAKQLDGKVRFVLGDGRVVQSVRRISLDADGSLRLETLERHVGEKALAALEPVVLKPVTTKVDAAASKAQ